MSQGEITKIKDTNMLTKGVITEMGYRALKVSNLVRILWEIGRHDCVSLFSEEGIDLTPLGIGNFYPFSFIYFHENGARFRH